MGDRVSFRATFLDPSKEVEARPSPVLPARARTRLQAKRHATAAKQGDVPSQTGEPSEAHAFVFSTPGGPSVGAKAVRSGKKSSHEGRTLDPPFDGSPMQWSPFGSEMPKQPGSTSTTVGPPPELAGNRWRPGSNANIANAAVLPSTDESISAELMTRLHLSDSENLPQEFHTRLHLSGAQQPIKQEANDSEPAAASEAALPEQLRSKLQIDPTASLAKQFQAQVAVSDSRPAADGRPTTNNDSVAAQTAAPTSSNNASAGFVFSADLSGSPEQRQQQFSRSPAGHRKQRAAYASVLMCQANAGGPPLPSQAAPNGQPPTSAFFVFGGTRPSTASSSTPGQQDTTERPQCGNAQGNNPQIPSSVCSAASQQQHPAGVAEQPFVFGKPQRPIDVQSSSFVTKSGSSTASLVFDDKSGLGTAFDSRNLSEPQRGAPRTGQKGILASRRSRRKGTSVPPIQGLGTGAGLRDSASALPGAVLFANLASSSSPGKLQDQPPVVVNLEKEIAASSACESYRNEGNEAFKMQDYQTAHDLYTKAIKALWPCPSLHPRLALLLSNRAAALLSLGKPFLALKDCHMGLKYDPSFSRCALRIATCHYRLGDFEAAEQHLQAMNRGAAGDQALMAEIVGKLAEVQGHKQHVIATLTKLGHSITGEAAENGSQRQGKEQESIKSGLTELEVLWAHVPHAEYLHAAKAQALLRLGRYPQAIEACSASVHYDDTRKSASKELWRLWLEAQSTFHDGNYSATVKLLQELLQRRMVDASTVAEPFVHNAPKQLGESESSRLLSAIVPLPTAAQLEESIQAIEGAQHLRQQGNELMKQKKYTDAVQKYTEALSTPKLSAAFASILYSNRAAAHQGLRQWVLSVADCCRSKALAPAYAKAHSRLAALLMELRLHDAAVRALTCALQTPNLLPADRRDYESRLREAQRASEKKAGPRLMGTGGGSLQPDHYKLLMLDRSCSVEEVRKAYKRLALQLHPDKSVSTCRYSAQFSQEGAVVLPVLEAQKRLEEDAKWLFQCLGEAHEVLTDKSKRQNLDFELQMEERYNTDPLDSFGSFGGGGRRYGWYNSSSGSPSRNKGTDYADRLRRAAQQRQQPNGRGYYGFGGFSF